MQGSTPTVPTRPIRTPVPEPGRHRRGTLVVSGDPDADHLINTDPLALMIAMLLDQQIPIEWAFASPLRLAQRPRWTLRNWSRSPLRNPQSIASRP